MVKIEDRKVEDNSSELKQKQNKTKKKQDRRVLNLAMARSREMEEEKTMPLVMEIDEQPGGGRRGEGRPQGKKLQSTEPWGSVPGLWQGGGSSTLSCVI